MSTILRVYPRYPEVHLNHVILWKQHNVQACQPNSAYKYEYGTPLQYFIYLGVS